MNRVQTLCCLAMEQQVDEHELNPFLNDLNVNFATKGPHLRVSANTSTETPNSDAKETLFRTLLQSHAILSQNLEADDKLGAYQASTNQSESETAGISSVSDLAMFQLAANEPERGKVPPSSHSSFESANSLDLPVEFGMTAQALCKGSVLPCSAASIRSIETQKSTNRKDKIARTASLPISKKSRSGKIDGAPSSHIAERSSPPVIKEVTEEVLAVRAQRNRESAKRSRLKAKIYQERLGVCYEELKKENAELKRVVEVLLKPEYTKAPVEFRQNILALIRSPRKDEHGEPYP